MSEREQVARLIASADAGGVPPEKITVWAPYVDVADALLSSGWLTAVKADAWDEAMQALGWALNNGAVDFDAAVQYVVTTNPYRPHPPGPPNPPPPPPGQVVG